MVSPEGASNARIPQTSSEWESAIPYIFTAVLVANFPLAPPPPQPSGAHGTVVGSEGGEKARMRPSMCPRLLLIRAFFFPKANKIPPSTGPNDIQVLQSCLEGVAILPFFGLLSSDGLSYLTRTELPVLRRNRARFSSVPAVSLRFSFPCHTHTAPENSRVIEAALAPSFFVFLWAAFLMTDDGCRFG